MKRTLLQIGKVYTFFTWPEDLKQGSAGVLKVLKRGMPREPALCESILHIERTYPEGVIYVKQEMYNGRPTNITGCQPEYMKPMNEKYMQLLFRFIFA